MKALRLSFAILGLLMAVLFAGCSTPPRVVTDNTAFFVDSYKPKGSISVVSSEADVDNSLEFSAYRKKFERKLMEANYVIEEDPNKADYIALIAYEIDEGKKSIVSTPVYGQISSGTTYSSDTAHESNDTSDTTPTYGVIGSSTKSVTRYSRTIALDIVEASSFKDGNPEIIYEGRTKSKGNCSVIVEVFDEMLEAMFNDFPGENGRNRKQTISAASYNEFTINC